MVRSCRHHVQYCGSDRIECELHDNVPLTHCTACRDFVLKNTLAELMKNQPSAFTRSPPAQVLGVGTALKKRIAKLAFVQVDASCGCSNLVSKLDTMPIDQCDRQVCVGARGRRADSARSIWQAQPICNINGQRGCANMRSMHLQRIVGWSQPDVRAIGHHWCMQHIHNLG